MKKGDGAVFKRNKFLLLLLGIVLLFVTACGGAEADPDAKADDRERAERGAGDLSGEITFWTLSLSPDFDDYIHGLIEAFEEEHPDVKIIWQDVPFDQAEQKMLTSASAGNLADVINMNTDYLKKLAALGALVNMDEAAADVKDEYFPGIWSAGEIEGTVYALPWYVTSGGLLYNKELLNKAGIENPPSTYDEVWEMSKIIKEKTGAYGFTIGEIHRIMLLEGVQLVSEDYQSAAFNTPEGLEFFKKYKRYYDEGLIPKEILLQQVEPQEWYAQERVAFWETGPQLYRQVKDLSPETYEKSEAAPSLVGKAGILHTSIMNIAVSNKSKHKDAAVQFAKFVTSGENQLEFSKIVPVMPSVISAAEDDFFNEGEDADDPAEKGKYIAAQQLEKAENTFPPVEEVSEIFKVINEEFQKVLLEDKDPKQALDDAEERVNELLQ